jgi:hypothetical protein
MNAVLKLTAACKSTVRFEMFAPVIDVLLAWSPCDAASARPILTPWALQDLEHMDRADQVATP